MHELSIAMSILDIAAEESERRGGVAIKTIFVELGPFAGVVKTALVSSFELAREGSSFANSELVITDVPLVVYCSNCKAERTPASIQDLCCPECGKPCGDIVRGRELEIVAMEIEETFGRRFGGVGRPAPNEVGTPAPNEGPAVLQNEA